MSESVVIGVSNQVKKLGKMARRRRKPKETVGPTTPDKAVSIDGTLKKQVFVTELNRQIEKANQ